MADGFKIEYNEPGEGVKQLTIDELVNTLEEKTNIAEDAYNILKELLG